MANVAFLAERMRLGFGADLVVDQVASGLAARGHDVTVYATFEDGTYTDRPYKLEHIPVPAFARAPQWEAATLKHVKEFGLAARGHDLFFLATPPFYCLLPWLKERAIVIDCGVVDARGFPAKVRLNFAYMRHTQRFVYFRFAQHVAAISDFLRTQLPATVQERASTIYLGADHYPLASATDRAAMRHRFGVADDDVVALYVGRLNPDHQPYKGTRELVDTYSALRAEAPKLRLVMAGFGSEQDADWIRDAGGIPLLNVPVGDMPALYAAADLFVTCSRWEGFNLNIAEAQHAGVPVVAFKVGAHPEVVNAGNTGLLVQSSRGFADAFRELGTNTQRRQEFAARTQGWADRFRWDLTVDGYDDLVRHALTASQDRPVAP